MNAFDVKTLRNMLPEVWQRLTFDAFVLPVNDLGLPEAERRTFARRACEAVDGINWESYDLVRLSFMRLAEELLKVRPLADPVRQELQHAMYVRFMEGRIRYFMYREQVEHCRIPAVPVGPDDLHNTVLAAAFARLPDQPEVAAWLTRIPVSWTYDQLHMVTWFSGQLSLGSGKYSRSRPNHSARVTYERLLNPYSLLWIAAALGEDRQLVTDLGDAIRPLYTYREKCELIRSRIPWKRIYRLALPLVEMKKGA